MGPFLQIGRVQGCSFVSWGSAQAVQWESFQHRAAGCRCPRPSEVDSDGRGEKLLLLRSWKVGGVGVDNRLRGEESPD